MAKRLIRADEFGLYVFTGGYCFRPLAVAKRSFFRLDTVYREAAKTHLGVAFKETTESGITAASHVNATHRGGTTTAKVGDEIWVSSSVDPRSIAYSANYRPGG